MEREEENGRGEKAEVRFKKKTMVRLTTKKKGRRGKEEEEEEREEGKRRKPERHCELMVMGGD